MLPGTCNCDPFAGTEGSFCGNLHEQSSFFDGFSASHSKDTALSTPPDIWCQIVARFLISLIIELAIFVASICNECYLQFSLLARTCNLGITV
jgi:hypothetical protein